MDEACDVAIVPASSAPKLNQTSANSINVNQSNNNNNNNNSLHTHTNRHSVINSLTNTTNSNINSNLSAGVSSNSNSSCSSSSTSSNSSGYGSTTTTPTNNYDLQQTTPTTTPVPTTPVAIAEPIIPVATIAAVTPFYNESITTHNLETHPYLQQPHHHLLQPNHHQMPQNHLQTNLQQQHHSYPSRQHFYSPYEYQQTAPMHNLSNSAALPSVAPFNVGIAGPYEMSSSALNPSYGTGQYKTSTLSGVLNYERSPAARSNAPPPPPPIYNSQQHQPQQQSEQQQSKTFQHHTQQFSTVIQNSSKQRSSSLIGNSTNTNTSKPQAAATPFYAQSLSQTLSNPTPFYDNLKHKINLDFHDTYSNPTVASYHQQQKYYAAAKSQLKEASYGSGAVLNNKSMYSNSGNYFPGPTGSLDFSSTTYDKYMYPHVQNTGFSTTEHLGNETSPEVSSYRKPVVGNSMNSTSWPWGIDYTSGNSRTIPPLTSHLPTATVAPTHATYLTPNPTALTRDSYFLGYDKYGVKYDKYATPSYQQSYVSPPANRHNLWPNTAHSSNLTQLNERHLLTTGPTAHPSHGLHTHFIPNNSTTGLNSRQSCCSQPYQPQSCYYPPSHSVPSRVSHTQNPALPGPGSGYLSAQPPLGQSSSLNSLSASCKYSGVMPDYGNGNKLKNSNDLYLNTHQYDSTLTPHNFSYGSGLNSQQIYANNAPQSIAHKPKTPPSLTHDSLNANASSYTNDLSLSTSNFDNFHQHLETHPSPQTFSALHSQHQPPAYGPTATKRALLDYRKPMQPQAPPTIGEISFSSIESRDQYNQHQELLNTPETTTTFGEYDAQGDNPTTLSYSHTTAVLDETDKSGNGSNKNLSLRDFIANWNDDEDEYQNNEELSFDQNNVIDEVLQTAPVEQEKTRNTAAVEVEGIKNDDCEKAIENVAPLLNDTFDNQYVNLPDIVIDIEKSTNINSSITTPSTSPTPPPAESAQSAKQDVTSVSLNLSDFDVEKELDELKLKKPAQLELTKDLNDIRETKDVSTAQLSPSKNHSSQHNLDESNLEPDAKTVANAMATNNHSSELGEQYFKDIEGYESGSSRHSNESAFEKEYETFINKITSEATANKSGEKKSFDTDTEIDFDKNVQDFSKFYKRKRKLKENELKSVEPTHLSQKKSKMNLNIQVNNSNFPQGYTKKTRKRFNIVNKHGPHKRKICSMFYKIMHSIRRFGPYRVKRVRAFMAELKEKHLPLIKRQSIKNYTHDVTESFFNAKSLKGLCLMAINTEEFREMLMSRLEAEQDNCLESEEKHICTDPSCETCEVIKSLMEAESFEGSLIQQDAENNEKHFSIPSTTLCVGDNSEPIVILEDVANIVDTDFQNKDIILISNDTENIQCSKESITMSDIKSEEENTVYIPNTQTNLIAEDDFLDVGPESKFNSDNWCDEPRSSFRENSEIIPNSSLGENWKEPANIQSKGLQGHLGAQNNLNPENSIKELELDQISSQSAVNKVTHIESTAHKSASKQDVDSESEDSDCSESDSDSSSSSSSESSSTNSKSNSDSSDTDSESGLENYDKMVDAHSKQSYRLENTKPEPITTSEVREELTKSEPSVESLTNKSEETCDLIKREQNFNKTENQTDINLYSESEGEKMTNSPQRIVIRITKSLSPNDQTLRVENVFKKSLESHAEFENHTESESDDEGIIEKKLAPITLKLGLKQNEILEKYDSEKSSESQGERESDDDDTSQKKSEMSSTFNDNRISNKISMENEAEGGGILEKKLAPIMLKLRPKQKEILKKYNSDKSLESQDKRESEDSDITQNNSHKSKVLIGDEVSNKVLIESESDDGGISKQKVSPIKLKLGLKQNVSLEKWDTQQSSELQCERESVDDDISHNKSEMSSTFNDNGTLDKTIIENEAEGGNISEKKLAPIMLIFSPEQKEILKKCNFDRSSESQDERESDDDDIRQNNSEISSTFKDNETSNRTIIESESENGCISDKKLAPITLKLNLKQKECLEKCDSDDSTESDDERKSEDDEILQNNSEKNIASMGDIVSNTPLKESESKTVITSESNLALLTLRLSPNQKEILKICDFDKSSESQGEIQFENGDILQNNDEISIISINDRVSKTPLVENKSNDGGTSENKLATITFKLNLKQVDCLSNCKSDKSTDSDDERKSDDDEILHSKSEISYTINQDETSNESLEESGSKNEDTVPKRSFELYSELNSAACELKVGDNLTKNISIISTKFGRNSNPDCVEKYSSESEKDDLPLQEISNTISKPLIGSPKTEDCTEIVPLIKALKTEAQFDNNKETEEELNEKVLGKSCEAIFNSFTSSPEPKESVYIKQAQDIKKIKNEANTAQETLECCLPFLKPSLLKEENTSQKSSELQYKLKTITENKSEFSTSVNSLEKSDNGSMNVDLSSLSADLLADINTVLFDKLAYPDSCKSEGNNLCKLADNNAEDSHTLINIQEHCKTKKETVSIYSSPEHSEIYNLSDSELSCDEEDDEIVSSDSETSKSKETEFCELLYSRPKVNAEENHSIINFQKETISKYSSPEHAEIYNLSDSDLSCNENSDEVMPSNLESRKNSHYSTQKETVSKNSSPEHCEIYTLSDSELSSDNENVDEIVSSYSKSRIHFEYESDNDCAKIEPLKNLPEEKSMDTGDFNNTNNNNTNTKKGHFKDSFQQFESDSETLQGFSINKNTTILKSTNEFIYDDDSISSKNELDLKQVEEFSLSDQAKETEYINTTSQESNEQVSEVSKIFEDNEVSYFENENVEKNKETNLSKLPIFNAIEIINNKPTDNNEHILKCFRFSEDPVDEIDDKLDSSSSEDSTDEIEDKFISEFKNKTTKEFSNDMAIKEFYTFDKNESNFVCDKNENKKSVNTESLKSSEIVSEINAPEQAKCLIETCEQDSIVFKDSVLERPQTPTFFHTESELKTTEGETKEFYILKLNIKDQIETKKFESLDKKIDDLQTLTEIIEENKPIESLNEAFNTEIEVNPESERCGTPNKNESILKDNLKPFGKNSDPKTCNMSDNVAILTEEKVTTKQAESNSKALTIESSIPEIKTIENKINLDIYESNKSDLKTDLAEATADFQLLETSIFNSLVTCEKQSTNISITETCEQSSETRISEDAKDLNRSFENPIIENSESLSEAGIYAFDIGAAISHESSETHIELCNDALNEKIDITASALSEFKENDNITETKTETTTEPKTDETSEILKQDLSKTLVPGLEASKLSMSEVSKDLKQEDTDISQITAAHNAAINETKKEVINLPKAKYKASEREDTTALKIITEITKENLSTEDVKTVEDISNPTEECQQDFIKSQENIKDTTTQDVSLSNKTSEVLLTDSEYISAKTEHATTLEKYSNEKETQNSEQNEITGKNLAEDSNSELEDDMKSFECAEEKVGTDVQSAVEIEEDIVEPANKGVNDDNESLPQTLNIIEKSNSSETVIMATSYSDQQSQNRYEESASETSLTEDTPSVRHQRENCHLNLNEMSNKKLQSKETITAEDLSEDFLGFKIQSSIEDESEDFHGFEDLEEVTRIRQEIENLNDDSEANDGFLHYPHINKGLHKSSTTSLTSNNAPSEINELEALEKELSQNQPSAIEMEAEVDETDKDLPIQPISEVSTNDIEHIKQMLESDEELQTVGYDINETLADKCKDKSLESSKNNLNYIISSVNSIIPKLSDLCRAALNSSLNSNTNLAQQHTETSTLLVERELSVEEALAEMYRQAGVLLSDPEDFDNDTPSPGNNDAHDVLLINLQEILNSDNNDVYVLQCDMDEHVLNVMQSAAEVCNKEQQDNEAPDTERVNTLQIILDTQSPEPQIHIISSDSESEVIILSDDESEFSYRPFMARSERVVIPFINDNVEMLNSDSFSDISTIHHEEIVPENLNKFLQEEFYKYLHEKYVQRYISKYYHANRVLKKYKKRIVKPKRQ